MAVRSSGLVYHSIASSIPIRRLPITILKHCDGEAEVISIKSGSNAVKENIFRECQGSVVLRHGDNNPVAGNIFLGNDKPGTGGVRVINKGQAVVSNLFYRCRGDDFRSPLAIMNGIPNSPAHRYVQVTNAQIISNTFYECAPMSLGEGSDTERTLPPDDVVFAIILFTIRGTALSTGHGMILAVSSSQRIV